MTPIYTISLSGSIAVGKNFWVTINTKQMNFQATTTVVADVIAGLLAALTATDGSVPAEFQEATWANPSPGTITATGVTAGVGLSISVGTDGAATFTVATTTAATGPTWWSDANNWADGSVPVNGDDVVIDNFAGDITDGLDQSAVTLNSLTVGMSFTGTIGRPRENDGGYPEYRDLALKVGATSLKIGVGQGSGSGRIKIDVGSIATNAEVENSGTSLETDVPAVLLAGTHASNVWDISGGTVGLAFFQDELATAASLTVSSQATCYCGPGLTVTNVVTAGTLNLYSATSSLKVYGGVAQVFGSAGHTSIDVKGGQLNYLTSGTAAAVALGPGVIDTSLDSSPRTFTAFTGRSGGVVNDPSRTISYGSIAVDTSVSGVSFS